MPGRVEATVALLHSWSCYDRAFYTLFTEMCAGENLTPWRA